MNYSNSPAEYPHNVPKCQSCGWVGPWRVEPLLMTHHIIIFVLLLLAFGGGLVYLVIVLIIRGNEDSRGKICPNCGAKNMHTFVYTDSPGAMAPVGGQYMPQQAQYGAPAFGQQVAPSATTYNPSGAGAGSRSAVIHVNGQPVRTLLLDPGTRYTVGRSPDSSVQMNDSMVSSKHGAFEVASDGSLRYTDSGSTNGSFLNGAQVTGPVRVAPGDALTLGSDGTRVTVSL